MAIVDTGITVTEPGAAAIIMAEVGAAVVITAAAGIVDHGL
jgi:hypothetical protein